jgi:hypothetical protein
MIDKTQRNQKIELINKNTVKTLKKLMACYIESLELDLTKIDDICFRDEFLLYSKNLL